MELEKIKDELFCLKYEMETLAELLNKGHVERWVHGYITQKIEDEHLKRYEYAIKYTKDKVVLDIAGGSGYGSYLLAELGQALSVDSVDIDKNAIIYGNKKYDNSKINRFVANAEEFVNENKYDLIVSFETIEHLKNHTIFLNNIYKSLKKGGELIISSPIAQNTTKDNLNVYHEIEWSFVDFQKLLSKNFEIKNIYLQSVIIKKDLKEPLLDKIIRNLCFRKYKERDKPVFEKYENQYSIKDIVSGYQVLHCIKK